MSYPRREEDQVGWWQGQIEFSRRRMKPLFEASKVLVRQYYNEASGEREAQAEDAGLGDSHLHRTKCSLIFGWIDQSLANMIDRNPLFRCVPDNPQASARIHPEDPNSLTFAEGVGRIVNYRYRELNQQRVDERVALDAFLWPYGVAKIGYTLDMEARRQELVGVGEDGLVIDEPEDENLYLGIGQETLVHEGQDHRAHLDAHTSLLQGGLAMMGVGTEAIRQVEPLIDDHIKLHKQFLYRKAPDSNTNVRRETPFAVRWLPEMFLTDVLSLEGPNDARWVAFGWELPVDEVRATPEYRNTKDLQPLRLTGAPDRLEGLDEDGLDVVRGWEIWAKDFPVGRGRFEDRLIVIAEGCDKFLRNEDEWPYTNLDDYPAETLVYNPGYRSWYCKSPLLMGGGDTVQGLVNEILDSYLSIVRKQKNLWLVDPSTGLDTDAISDLLDAPDGSVIEVPGLAEAGANLVVPLPFHQVPPEKGELLAILQGMFDRSLGTPQPMSMPQSDTATQASIVEKRNTSREERRSGLLTEFQTRKAMKMWQLDCQYRPKKLFLVDRDAELFLGIGEEMAKGEYLFTIDITSHVAALSLERSQWMDLLNLFAGLTPVMMQTGGAPPNLQEIARRLLVRGFNEREVESIFPPAQPQAPAPEGMPGMPGMPPEAGVEGQGSGTEFADPAAQAAQEGVKDGRMVDKNIGPLQRDSFNRDNPEQGRLEGAAEKR